MPPVLKIVFCLSLNIFRTSYNYLGATKDNKFNGPQDYKYCKNKNTEHKPHKYV